MPVSDHQMIEAWKQVLTLSKLKAGQSVTVLTSAATHPQTLQCALIASQAMGAIVNRLDLPPVNAEKALRPRQPGLPRHHATDRQPRGHRGPQGQRPGARPDDAAVSPEQHEILASGTKILLAVEPPEVLVRMVPTLADRTRVKAAAARIGAAREMHVVSAAGTTCAASWASTRRSASTASSTNPGAGTTGRAASR